MAEHEHFTKEDILERCLTARPDPGHNRMGCSEAWYDPFYCIGQVFPEDERNAMSEAELNNLYRLANEIGKALY